MADDTFDMMRSVETAQSIIRNARSNLVSRLNSYATEHRVLFEQALDMVAHEFMHIVKRQALMGCAIIRSNNPMLENPLCLNMVLGESAGISDSRELQGAVHIRLPCLPVVTPRACPLPCVQSLLMLLLLSIVYRVRHADA